MCAEAHSSAYQLSAVSGCGGSVGLCACEWVVQVSCFTHTASACAVLRLGILVQCCLPDSDGCSKH